MSRVGIRPFKCHALAWAAAALLGLGGTSASFAAEPVLSGKELINAKCASCHAAQGDGRWFRISEGRRTPEGWDMTVVRMDYAHGVKLTAEERQRAVKYLSDHFGLAPSETQNHRYILERQPNVLEKPGQPLLAEMCVRCHSAARIAVQRRTEDDWRRLVNFHVGQFPSIEYSAGGRDRNWFDIASKDVVQVLAKLNGYESAAWRDWQAAPAPDASGRWRLVGYRPGDGAYEGEADIRRADGEDRYALSVTLRWADGRSESAQGRSIVYGKHEWRATLQLADGTAVQQVMSIEPGGRRMSGRWFLAAQDGLGGDLVAVRADAQAPSAVLSVVPAALRAGSTQTITLHGANLAGDVSLGPDLRVLEVVSRDADKVVVKVAARAGARDGLRSVRVGTAQLPVGLPVYRRVDYLKVEPEHPIARLGGNGGSRAKLPVQLEAIAYAAGPDGQRGTKDDIRLGALPAQWSLDNLTPAAAEMGDADFAVGRMEPNGLFWPADAGPNPKRKFGTNNAGELKATAKVMDGNRPLSASVPLFVSVQRWNDPPIR